MSYLDLFRDIKSFVFDVDGVLTNGHVVLLPDGNQMRHMHSKDGYAIQLAVKKGYQVAAITGGSNEQVRDRLKGLGVQNIYLKISHKDEALDDFRFSCGLEYNQIMFMGDDIPDLAAMRHVGLPACPADASPEVRAISKYVSKLKGGEGCVRDIIEKIMRSHQTWFDTAINMDNIADFTW